MTTEPTVKGGEIMHTLQPTNIHINKSALMVHHTLEQNWVESFSIKVVLWVLGGASIRLWLLSIAPAHWRAFHRCKNPSTTICKLSLCGVPMCHGPSMSTIAFHTWCTITQTLDMPTPQMTNCSVFNVCHKSPEWNSNMVIDWNRRT